MPRAQERREVFYEGLVQGVGFRYTARSIASGFQVSGFVRNLSDGRVQLRAEGAPQELDRYLAAVKARMDRYITSIESASQAATGEYDGFEIRSSL